MVIRPARGDEIRTLRGGEFCRRPARITRVRCEAGTLQILTVRTLRAAPRCNPLACPSKANEKLFCKTPKMGPSPLLPRHKQTPIVLLSTLRNQSWPKAYAAGSGSINIL